MEPEYAALDAWYVVIDTSAIHDDFDLSQRDTQTLLEAAPALNLRVCVPEVVVLEMVVHYREGLEQARRSHDAARRVIARALGRELAHVFAPDELRQASKTYEVKLRRRLRELGVTILPLPRTKASLLSLFRRGQEKQKRKPLKENGQGLKDALLWESIVELCRRDPLPVVIITRNTKDFALESSKSQLDRDLVDDLSAVGVERTELYTSIGAFNNTRLHLIARFAPEHDQ